MSAMGIIKDRTERKELRLSGNHVKTKEEYLALGAIYLGAISTAASHNYFTIRKCDKLAQPVTGQELASITHFAMMKDCYQSNCIRDSNGRHVRPCIPVFYRSAE